MNFHIKGSTLASICYTRAFCIALQNQLYLAALWFYPSTPWVLCYGWTSSHARGILINRWHVVTPLAHNCRLQQEFGPWQRNMVSVLTVKPSNIYCITWASHSMLSYQKTWQEPEDYPLLGHMAVSLRSQIWGS